MDEITEQGYVLLKGIIEPEFCHQLKINIQQRLKEFILMHQCSSEVYFSAVSRWPLAALINNAHLNSLKDTLSNLITNLHAQPLTWIKADVLYKSPYAPLATPCHQDIAYASTQPYDLSTWIPLHDVSLKDSPLQFLPRSHRLPITPAIDFWQPNFVDKFKQTEIWQDTAISMPMRQGDAIFFSSHIWHASSNHTSATERFAIAIRWGNLIPKSIQIPQPKQVEFGMWNCGEITEKILNKGMQIIFKQDIKDFVLLIKKWQELIQNKQSLSFIFDDLAAYAALEKLRILHEAYCQYKGSDGQGTVYANLWQVFLKQLNNYLKTDAINK